ncbi:MAG: alpha-mannosidase [Lentisphaerales bacterium]|nr:MAG: alpha-mannosidase [Lentisphaerales bacterium]
MPENIPVGHVIPHTHWDREWRYPLWQTRMMLVEFLDELLEILERDPEYKTFLLDGQVVILEDYLEFKPENTKKVKEYISAGRITAGPWYTLPDLYPVDGESLVRNLLKGVRLSDSLGGHLNIGYTSFGWGQTAQFPQIFKGFGIDFITTAKHLSNRRCPESEFIWESPDGTALLTTKLGYGGRHSLFINAYVPIMHGAVNNSPDYKFNWKESGLIYHEADDANSWKDYFKLRNTGKIRNNLVKEAMDAAWNNTEPTTVKSDRLLLAGCAFSSPLASITEIVRIANSLNEDKKFKMSTLSEYADVLKKRVDIATLRTIKGELRDGPSGDVAANALQTRSYIKRMNKNVQNRIFGNAEPFSVMDCLVGGEYQSKYLNRAMEYMLKAHAHDSINGVTQDKTANDVIYRLAQAEELADIVSNHACGDLIGKIDMSSFNPDDVLLVLMNPTQYVRSEVVKVWVDIPVEQNIWEFDIVDKDGKNLEIQHVSRLEEMVPVHDFNARPWPFTMVRHCIYLKVENLPSFGYSVCRVVPGTRMDQIWKDPTAMRSNSGNDISKSATCMENENLKVTINNNGSINIFDKMTKKVFENLNYFEDTGDNGEYWTFYSPYNNKTYFSHGCQAEIWVEDNGPLSATIGVKLEMNLPAYSIVPERGYKGESRRSDEMRAVPILIHYTLNKDSRRVDVRLVIENRVEDHRMRVLFDTGIRSEFSHAAGHFTVDKRPVKPIREAPNGDFYPEMQTLPQQFFVDVNDRKNGFALLNNCLSEFEAMDNEAGTVALTLFRSTRNAVCTEGRCWSKFPKQKGGQSFGPQEYTYSILPHSGDWVEAGIYKEAVRMNIPLKLIETSKHSGENLPLEKSFLEISDERLVVSALKKCEDRDGYILRLFNPTENRIESNVRIEKAIKHVYLTDLNETRQEELTIGDAGVFTANAGSHKIVTFELAV